MENSGTYCRLCAKPNRSEETLNFSEHYSANKAVYEKLKLLNGTVLDIEENLPTTVCVLCVANLESVVNFARAVQSAQHTLRYVLFGIKKETQSFSFDHPIFQTMEFIDSPSESDKQNMSDSTTANESNLDISEYVKVQLNDIPGREKSKRKKKLTENALKKRRQTWKFYKWTCYICGLEYNNLKQLVGHSLEQHHNCTTYKCTDCNKRNLRLNTFVQHVKKHRSYLRFSCHLCFEVFAQPKDVVEHVKDHYKEMHHVCDGCNSNFTNHTEMIAHVRSYHRDHRKFLKTKMSADGKFYCDSCEKVFLKRSLLHSHRARYHTDRTKKHKCDQCGANYYTLRELKVHMDTKHSDETPYQCQICTLAFKTFRRLQIHTKRHESANIPCNLCGRIFRTEYLRRKHFERIHMDLPHVLCPNCGRSFKTEIYLRRHMLQHTGEKPFSCNICSHDFTNWGNWAKHMRQKHGVEVAKRKRTLAGPFPVDPMTGGIVLPQTSAEEAEEWVKSLRPKRRVKEDGNT